MDPTIPVCPSGSDRAFRRGKKKADVADPSQGFDHVGLLVNQPCDTAARHFNESSELEFTNLKEPIPTRHRLRTVGIIPSGARKARHS